jgi:hypothetical protein
MPVVQQEFLGRNHAGVEIDAPPGGVGDPREKRESKEEIVVQGRSPGWLALEMANSTFQLVVPILLILRLLSLLPFFPGARSAREGKRRNHQSSAHGPLTGKIAGTIVSTLTRLFRFFCRLNC